MDNTRDFERGMRVEEAKGLVSSLKSFDLNLEHAIDIDGFRLKLAMLENSIKSGVTLNEIGITEEELTKFKDLPSKYLEKK